VELSRPVYRELHKIRTLTKLHIRMQSGESYYTTPPPLPLLLDDVPPQGHWSDLPPPPLTPPFPPPATSGSSSNFLTSKFKGQPGKRPFVSSEPPTISGFGKLKSLSVLDIDTLDVVTELKTCVRNSSSTLKELQLSLSDSLASQARNTLAGDSDPEDSDVDDEFHVPPASPPDSNFGDHGPTKTFRSQEERKLQESVLGRIFDVEPFIVKKSPFQRDPRDASSKNDKTEEAGNDDVEDVREEFVAALKGVSTRLMALSNGSRHFSASQQDILDVIEKAARKYVESRDVPAKASEGESSGGNNSGAAEDSAETQENDSEKSEENALSSLPTSSNFSKGKGVQRDMTPDDIDIEHPDEDEDDVDDEEPDDQPGKLDEEKNSRAVATANALGELTSSNGLTLQSRAVTTYIAGLENSQTLTSNLSHFQEQSLVLGQKIRELREEGSNVDLCQVEETHARVQELIRSSAQIESQVRTVGAEIDDLKNMLPSDQGKSKSGHCQRSMDDYIRDTRGFSLETLSIHLIPVKASVLSRAMDLSCIKNLTLLNVGNQAPIWSLLVKENKVRPLALRSVFTDNVSTAFLNCMSQLDELHELFLLERGSKHRPESFAPKSTVTMDQIRRLVLKKHMPTLKRLMIKDESSGSKWDANQKAMILICNAGAQLEELAVSMNIHAVVRRNNNSGLRTLLTWVIACFHAVFCWFDQVEGHQHPPLQE
jgi:hypothetical protein